MDQNPFQNDDFKLEGEERILFESFKAQCMKRGLLQHSTTCHDDISSGLNDDTALLRFLVGRSFDVDEALKQYEAARAIRLSVKAEEAYDSVDIDEFEDTRHLYPHWSGRCDKNGHPICVFDLSLLSHSAMSKCDKKRAVVFHDYLARFVLPLCSMACDRPNLATPVTSAMYLVDASGLTLTQGWAIRNYAQDLSGLLATCYPEVIEKIYVLKAPAMFGKIWALLSRWIDPRTAAKLVVVPPCDTSKVLSQCIDIENVPKQFGGEFEYQHGMAPKLDSRLSASITWLSEVSGQLPAGPVKWARPDEKGYKMIAVGSDGGIQRRETVGRVAWQPQESTI